MDQPIGVTPGGLTVTVGGSDGADMDLIEARQALAPIMLHPRYLCPVGTDWNDRKRVWEALAASGDEWQGINPGPNLYVHARADGTEIVAGYAGFDRQTRLRRSSTSR